MNGGRPKHVFQTFGTVLLMRHSRPSFVLIFKGERKVKNEVIVAYLQQSK